MTATPAIRPDWSALPTSVRAGIEDRLGVQVAAAQTASGGFTPGVASRLELRDDSRTFVKALPTGHFLAGMYDTEHRICAALPAAVPAPAMLWQANLDGWIVLAFEHVDGHHPDLAPETPDLTALRRALTQLAAVDCPEQIPARDIAFTGWADTGAWPEHNKELVTWEQRCDITGTALVHADLRADNMLRRADGALALVDWAAAMPAADWMDSAFVVPQLIAAGHEPAHAEQALAGVPAWDHAPGEAVTAFAVGLCGVWEKGYRSADGALADYRKRAAAAGRTWIRHRLEWR